MDLIRLLARVGADTSEFDSGMAHIRNTALGLAGGIALGLTAAVAGGVAASVKVAADFDASLDSLASSTGATVDQVKAIREEALGIGKDTSLSASEAVNAMSELAKAGMSTEKIVGGAARSVVQLAEATGSDVSNMAILVSNSMNTFQKDMLSASEVANIVAKSVNASAIGTNDYAMSLSAVGPIAQLAGLTTQDFATAIGIMGNNALKGSDAGTSLKTMLTSLAAPTDGARKLMNQLGLSLYTSSGAVKPFRDVIGELQRGLKGATDEQTAFTLKTLFGADAIRVGSILLKEGVEGWDAFGAAMGAAPDIAEQARVRLDNLKGTIDQFQGSLETAGIVVGSKFLPGLEQIAKTGLEGFNDLAGQDWSGASASLDELGGAFLRVATPVGNAAAAVRRAMGLDEPNAIPNLVKNALDVVTGVLDGVQPHVETFSRIFQDVVDGDIQSAFHRLAGFGDENTAGFVEGVQRMGSAGGQALVDAIGEYGPKSVEAMVVVNQSLENWAKTTLYTALKAAVTDAVTRSFQEAVRTSLSSGPGDFWNNVTTTVTDPAKLAKFNSDLMSFMLGPIGSVFKGVAEAAARDFIAGFISFVKANFRWSDAINPMGAADMAKRGFDQAVQTEKARQQNTPSFPSAPGITGPDTPFDVAGEFAEGGYAEAGKSYLIGERRMPEILTMGDQGGLVTPIDKLVNGSRETSQAFTFENHFHGADMSNQRSVAEMYVMLDYMTANVMRRFAQASKAIR